jgi:hypothetical protein
MRFSVITVGEPPEQWDYFGLLPGAYFRLMHNGETFRIVGRCRSRGKLLVRRLG